MTADQSTLESVRSILSHCLQLGSPLPGGLPRFESMAVVHVLGVLEQH